jgi:hypothetical protein
MVFFYQFTNGLTERYPELYEPSTTPTQHQINFAKKWKSYSTIIELANGDIRLMDEITELPLEKCLLFLAYKADKALLESLVHKEIMKSRG